MDPLAKGGSARPGVADYYEDRRTTDRQRRSRTTTTSIIDDGDGDGDSRNNGSGRSQKSKHVLFYFLGLSNVPVLENKNVTFCPAPKLPSKCAHIQWVPGPGAWARGLGGQTGSLSPGPGAAKMTRRVASFCAFCPVAAANLSKNQAKIVPANRRDQARQRK